MISEWLYDKNGDAQLYLEEDKIIYKDDRQIGTLDGKDVYAISGELIGSYSSGVLYDTDSRPVAFTEAAKGYIPSGTDLYGSSTVDDNDFAPNEPGESGEPYVPVHGGWSDVTVEELFGLEV